jgi:hypothetical protein
MANWNLESMMGKSSCPRLPRAAQVHWDIWRAVLLLPVWPLASGRGSRPVQKRPGGDRCYESLGFNQLCTPFSKLMTPQGVSLVENNE